MSLPTMRTGWIGVDFDGVLAFYDKWRDDPCNLGDPVPIMVNKVQAWLAQGMRIKIFTARVDPMMPSEFIDTQVKIIEEWCRQHIGQTLEVTACKDLHMLRLYDDRCEQIIPNTGLTLREYYESKLAWPGLK